MILNHIFFTPLYRFFQFEKCSHNIKKINKIKKHGKNMIKKILIKIVLKIFKKMKYITIMVVYKKFSSKKNFNIMKMWDTSLLKLLLSIKFIYCIIFQQKLNNNWSRFLYIYIFMINCCKMFIYWFTFKKKFEEIFFRL